MGRTLEKDLVAGALLSEVIRQHPEDTLSPAFIDGVLSAAESICALFINESATTKKRSSPLPLRK